MYLYFKSTFLFLTKWIIKCGMTKYVQCNTTQLIPNLLMLQNLQVNDS